MRRLAMSDAVKRAQPLTLSERLKRLTDHGRAVYFGNRRAGERVFESYKRALLAERDARRAAEQQEANDA